MPRVVVIIAVALTLLVVVSPPARAVKAPSSVLNERVSDTYVLTYDGHGHRRYVWPGLTSTFYDVRYVRVPSYVTSRGWCVAYRNGDLWSVLKGGKRYRLPSGTTRLNVQCSYQL